MKAMTDLMRINHSDVEFHTQLHRTYHHFDKETNEYVVLAKKFVGNDLDSTEIRLIRNPIP